jgi:hypothetical protein
MTTFARQLAKYKLDMLGLEEARWDRDDTEPTGNHISFLWKWE